MSAQKFHCAQNEVQIYKVCTQSPSQSGCYLPLQSFVLFCFVFLQSSTKTKAEYLLFDPMPHTFQHPAFFYDVPPPGFLPCVVQRTWGLKSIEFKAKPKYFQIM